MFKEILRRRLKEVEVAGLVGSVVFGQGGPSYPSSLLQAPMGVSAGRALALCCTVGHLLNQLFC